LDERWADAGVSRPFSCHRFGLGQSVKIKPSRTFVQWRHFFKWKKVPRWLNGETPFGPFAIAAADINSCHKCSMFRGLLNLKGGGSSRVPLFSFPGFPFCSFQLYTLPAFRVGDKLGECQLPAAGGELDFERVR
jgi:hypothetical protein